MKAGDVRGQSGYWLIAVALLRLACSSGGSEPSVRGEEKGSDPELSATALPQQRDPAKKITWRALPVADGCTLRAAQNPQDYDLMLDWQPCDRGIAGCRETDLDPRFEGFSGSRSFVRLSRGGPLPLAAVRFSMPGPYQHLVLTPFDGAPFSVLEKPANADCAVRFVGLSNDGAVVEISYQTNAEQGSSAFLQGPAAKSDAWFDVAARLLHEDAPDYVAESVSSVQGRVVVSAAGGPIRWFDPDSRRWIDVPGSKGCWQASTRSSADLVLFGCAGLEGKIRVARLGQAATDLRVAPKDGGVSMVDVDGRTAVWIEGHDRDRTGRFAFLVLWTGELSEQGELLNARPIKRLARTRMVDPSLAGAWAVVPVGFRMPEGRVEVVHLADGETRVLPVWDGVGAPGFFWHTRDEIFVTFTARPDGLGPQKLRRLPLTSLPLAADVDVIKEDGSARGGDG